jgi:hypothetical protein
MAPERSVGLAEALHVLCFVEVLEETETDDAIVGTFVKGDLGSTGGWGLGENGVYAVGVEDFVDAGILSVVSLLMGVLTVKRPPHEFCT